MLRQIRCQSNNHILDDFQRAINSTANGINLHNEIPSNESEKFQKFVETGFMDKELNPFGIPISMLAMKK